MKTDWDYSGLAKAYLARPQYADEAVNAMFSISDVTSGSRTCDVGAGVGHLTKHHIRNGFDVTAVEPNDAMREIGIRETTKLGSVIWKEGTGEETGLEDDSFKLVTFGSSFNVCDRLLALKETKRILTSSGWFACMWNHRDLEDPIQSEIESIISKKVSSYQYGSRREDQTKIIRESGLFGNVISLSAGVVHSQTISECVEAWKSHATLERQAGSAFEGIIREIEEFLIQEVGNNQADSFPIPYTTRIWIAQLR
jgi:ubiquinone/menaquinone biosynthesis C-methylase UbiE